MDIEIHSASSVVDVVKMSPAGTYDVLSIRDPGAEFMPVDAVREDCRSVEILTFDDAWLPEHAGMGATLPGEADIRRAMMWAQGQPGPFLVHCFAGISRSSAMAVVLRAMRDTPRIAAEVLDPERHWPNPLILDWGAHILGIPFPHFLWAVRRVIPAWPGTQGYTPIV